MIDLMGMGYLCHSKIFLSYARDWLPIGNSTLAAVTWTLTLPRWNYPYRQDTYKYFPTACTLACITYVITKKRRSAWVPLHLGISGNGIFCVYGLLSRTPKLRSPERSSRMNTPTWSMPTKAAKYVQKQINNSHT